MLPKGWHSLRLVEICRPKQWTTISKDKFTENGYPVFGANGQIGYFSDYTHASETIAITCRGATCGTINLVPAFSYITGNAMALDDLKTNLTTLGYLYQVLQFWGVSKSITGSAQPQITRESLSKVAFPFPPLPEQTRIAEVLGSVDAAIEATKAVIDQTKTVKQGLLQTLLTRGIGHTKFKDSPLGEIPESWDVKSGDALFKLGGGCSPSDLNLSDDGDVLFIKVDDLNHESNATTINEAKLKFKRHEQFKNINIYGAGTIIFAKRGAGIEKNRIRILGRDATVDPNIMCLNVNRGISSSFIRHYLYHLNLWNLADTTSVPQLNNKHLYPVSFRIPPFAEQNIIAARIDETDAHVSLETNKLSALQNLKAGLMNDLLTGKVRVDV